MSAIKLKKLRESFFKTVFTLLGHIANCDGYVNRDEIKRTQAYMAKMQLSDECKREAIQLFRAGSNPQLDIVGLLKEFSEAAEKTPTIIEVLLVYLISLARIDGLLVDKEIKVVRGVAAGLGYSTIIFDQLLRMISAQDKFSDNADGSAQSSSAEQKKPSSDNSSAQADSLNRGGGNGQTDKNNHSNKPHQKNYFSQRGAGSDRDLIAAYEALGATSKISGEELKKLYRKLVNQFHPDKLQGQGLPPELVNTATDRFKKIQGAYDYIKKHRA